MSVSSVGTSSYSAYTYQWKNQSLQGSTVNTQATQSASSAYSYNGLSTVSSMVELAQYAMEAMGVGSNDRVTFSQIEQYKTELEKEFNETMNLLIDATGISESASFSMNIAADGSASISSTHEDANAIKSYFAANPQWALDIRNALTEQGIALDMPVAISVSASGDIRVSSSAEDTTLDSEIGTDFISALESSMKETEDTSDEENAEADADDSAQTLTQAMILTRNTDGTLSVNSDHPQSEALTAQLAEDPSFAEELDALLAAEGADFTQSQTVTLNTDGSLVYEVPMDATEQEALRDYFENSTLGASMKSDMKSQGIDPDIDFRLSIVDGKVVVNSSHEDAATIQALFDNSAELTKLYMQVDALAGLESARKSMQVDPDTLRERIVIENMAAWWSTTGTSTVGSYFSGTLSTFSGVNSIV